jgi:hypothetical protein
MPVTDGEFKERWCEALESGRYRQGTHYLKTEYGDGDTRYCCLGVASELAAVPVAASVGEEGRQRVQFDFGAEHKSTTVAPDGWMGLASHEIGVLTVMNDAGTDFGRIARHIREDL